MNSYWYSTNNSRWRYFFKSLIRRVKAKSRTITKIRRTNSSQSQLAYTSPTTEMESEVPDDRPWIALHLILVHKPCSKDIPKVDSRMPPKFRNVGARSSPRYMHVQNSRTSQLCKEDLVICNAGDFYLRRVKVSLNNPQNNVFISRLQLRNGNDEKGPKRFFIARWKNSFSSKIWDK